MLPLQFFLWKEVSLAGGKGYCMPGLVPGALINVQYLHNLILHWCLQHDFVFIAMEKVPPFISGASQQVQGCSKIRHLLHAHAWCINADESMIHWRGNWSPISVREGIWGELKWRAVLDWVRKTHAVLSRVTNTNWATGLRRARSSRRSRTGFEQRVQTEIWTQLYARQSL